MEEIAVYQTILQKEGSRILAGIREDVPDFEVR
ncbi:MAG: hypothetical protein OD814_001447 [Candidatus Alkanophagales archaeon MCA70_species_1]|nr:hypothetical protein [Candidatus Alkanophaga volatiphilum]